MEAVLKELAATNIIPRREVDMMIDHVIEIIVMAVVEEVFNLLF